MVPLFKCLVAFCLIISLLVFIEGVYMNLVVLYVKLFKRKPEKVYKWEPMQEDIELGDESYPMVLVQIPMYNEKEVCNLYFISWTDILRLISKIYIDRKYKDVRFLTLTTCSYTAGP